MLDPLVRNIVVRQVAFLNPGGAVETRYNYTFMVGDHGPFVETFLGAEYFKEAVERRINELVAKLRETGAIPTPES